MNIGQIRKINPPVPYGVKSLLHLPQIGADPSLIYGLELEIENMGHLANPKDACVPGFSYHEDGSLRNNGAEYVSSPMRMRELSHCLHEFFSKNKLTENNYSERCSVHVHTNVTDLTLDQLRTLVFVYVVFEKVLFSFIGNERDKNIFCVPLYDTTMLQQLLNKDFFNHKMAKWEKYTALNFLPIFKSPVNENGQGSIEWRHMAGTCDEQYILLWCNLIGKMFAYARTHEWEPTLKFFLELNTSSAYKEAMMEVFQELSTCLEQTPAFVENLEEGVLRVKYSLSQKQEKKWPWGDNGVYIANVQNEPPPIPGGLNYIEDVDDGYPDNYECAPNEFFMSKNTYKQPINNVTRLATFRPASTRVLVTKVPEGTIWSLIRPSKEKPSQIRLAVSFPVGPPPGIPATATAEHPIYVYWDL